MTRLALESVSVDLGGRQLLSDVSFTVGDGEIVVLVGPNGAGKTTLLRTALGIVRPTAGRVTVDDRDVGSLAPRERAGLVAWLPQHLVTDDALSVLELTVAARYRFRESHARSREAALAALERARVVDLAARPITELSGGERQRVAIAGMLAQGAPLLLLDEPANHLDPAHQIDVMQLVGELWRDGLGIVYVTHDLNLVSHVGDADAVRVVGLAAGRVRFEERYSAAALPEKLGDLFSLDMEALDAHGWRVIVPRPREHRAR